MKFSDLMHLREVSPDAIIERALSILEERARYGATVMDSPRVVKDYLRLKLADLGHEVFAVVWLDAQNRVIEFEEMFRGTITQTSVYPREIVKRALEVNAAAVIIAHNHPSGSEEPSGADVSLTRTLTTALALVDVKVLDHFIVTRTSAVSFAERGLI